MQFHESVTQVKHEKHIMVDQERTLVPRIKYGVGSSTPITDKIGKQNF